MKRFFWTVSAGLLSLAISTAQGTCPAIVDAALNAVDAFCESAGRNQACYGNVQISAEAQEDARNFSFEQVGDVVSVTDIARLELEPLDETAGTWGVVLMRLQANLPDSAPGQNVTFLLFGDVTLEPNTDASEDYAAPMQAFYLRTGIGDAPCAEAPASGLIIQTPQGAKDIAFNVNGVDVQMGSTILFRAEGGNEMTVSSLEGAAVMKIGDTLYPVVAGTWARMALDENLNLLNAPNLPVAYRSEVLDALPLRALGREIRARLPLNEAELAELHKLLKEGKPPCAADNPILPRCEDLPFFNRAGELREAVQWAREARWGQNAREILEEARERLGETRQNLNDLRGTLSAPQNILPVLPTRTPQLPAVVPPTRTPQLPAVIPPTRTSEPPPPPAENTDQSPPVTDRTAEPQATPRR